MRKLVFSVFMIFAGVLMGCSKSSVNKLDSNNYEDRAKRIVALKAEITSFSEIIDAEFELFNVNGFSNSRTTLPGASSWDYQLAIKVQPKDVKKWVNGMTEITNPAIEYDYDWVWKIIDKRKENWKTWSDPKLFNIPGANVNVYQLIYEEEGIIFKRVLSN